MVKFAAVPQSAVKADQTIRETEITETRLVRSAMRAMGMPSRV